MNLLRRRFSCVLVAGILAVGCKDPGNKPGSANTTTSATASAAAEADASAADASVPETPPPKQRSVDRVVLITIDSMRGDQPWTGYELGSTPVLSMLAEASVVYPRAYAISNTTAPSLSSLMAVRYPTELERDNCPLAGFTFQDGLASVLSAAGVWTAAAHGHVYFYGVTAPSHGFADWRTIDRVASKAATDGAVTGPEVTELLLTLLQAAPADKPAFLWVHYMEPHDAYVAHKAFPPSKHPRRGLYDGEVAFADNEVGKVLAAIEASPTKDRTAVIVTADHGEAFGEHERFRHGFTVFEEELRVPLILHIPGQPPKRIDAPRSAMDIPRTVADLLGVEPPAKWRGHSLTEDWGDNTPKDRPVIVDVPELMNLPAQQVVVLGRHKVMKFGPRWTVYDVEADPLERKPLLAKDVEELVRQATEVLATIETVPWNKCTRQAFK